MDTISISTGEKRIAINGDPSRIIVFDPNDVLFAERFYHLIGDFQTRLTEFQERSKELDADTTTNGNGLPANMQARIDLMKEACTYTYEKIDTLFGPGTSEKVFQGALSMEAVMQFFKGLTPYIQTARVEKIAKYTNKKPKRIK